MRDGPLAELPDKGFIGYQEKHGDASISFRIIRIKALAKRAGNLQGKEALDKRRCVAFVDGA